MRAVELLCGMVLLRIPVPLPGSRPLLLSGVLLVLYSESSSAACIVMSVFPLQYCTVTDLVHFGVAGELLY